MNAQLYKRIISLIFFGLLIFIINQQSVQAQQENPLNLSLIRKTLFLRFRLGESNEEINGKLIAEINIRKVDFILTSEDEEVLKKAGGSDLLIKAIRGNLPKEVETKLIRIEEQKILYTKFTDNYNGTVEKKKIAIEAGKEFIKRYSDDRSVKEIIDYLVINVPQLEKFFCCVDPIPDRNRIYTKFDNSFKGKKWNDLFDAGAEILKREPELVDVTITLASVGFDELVNQSNRKYLNQTIDYAKESIRLMEANKKSTTRNYGVYNYSYKTENFPDGKANALGYMNYIVGYVKYFYLNQKDEAVSYFQNSLKYKSKAKELVNQLNLPSEAKQQIISN